MVKYVYDDIIKTLDYTSGSGGYIPREAVESNVSILGYFGDLKRTACEGYARSIMYIQNRLSIPTIHQVGV